MLGEVCTVYGGVEKNEMERRVEILTSDLWPRTMVDFVNASATLLIVNLRGMFKVRKVNKI